MGAWSVRGLAALQWGARGAITLPTLLEGQVEGMEGQVEGMEALVEGTEAPVEVLRTADRARTAMLAPVEGTEALAEGTEVPMEYTEAPVEALQIADKARTAMLAAMVVTTVAPPDSLEAVVTTVEAVVTTLTTVAPAVGRPACLASCRAGTLLARPGMGGSTLASKHL